MKKQLSLFGSLIALMMLSAMPAAAQVDEYLMIEGSATVNIKMTGTVSDWPDLWYSIDRGDWVKVTDADTRIDVPAVSYSHPDVGTVHFKGTNPAGFNRSSTDYLSIAITGGNPALKGNVMSLIGGDNFSSLTAIPCDYCFYGLFCPNPPSKFSTASTYHSTSSSTCLAHAKEMVLPATELKPYCYAYMFAYNTGLYDSPVLPATVMQPWCYAHMFEYCMNNFCSQTAYNSGTRLPNLPSQQLAEGCYAFMFNMCPSIYNGEDDWYCLPAEELAPHCYEGMFGTYRNSYYRYFKSLEIMATSLQDRCGNDIENCMRQMLNYNIMNQNAGQFGRGALNVRMYWTDWGNTDAGTAPTYGWFTGFLYSNCTFNYQKGLTPLTKVAKTNYAHTTMSSLFPYSCTLKENEFTYLTFDCKTNGGTWETNCSYDADLRRVVRSDYTAKTVPADPVKEGVSFKGWYTAPTGGTKVDKATILQQTTAQTYYAQFGEGGDEGGEGGGDNPQDDTDLSNIKMSRGVLDMPTYYSFAILGENEKVTVRLHFSTMLKTNTTNYLNNLTYDIANTYIQPAGGEKRQIASASLAKVEYLGDAYRAAHLTAKVTDTDGNDYNIDIFTNEELNAATYEDVIGTNYSFKVETSWRTCNPFHIYGTENNEMDRLFYRNYQGRHLLYTYHSKGGGSNPGYEVLHVQIELFPDASKPGSIPTGIYPINATQETGTAFIGKCPSDILIYEQNQRQPYCGSFVQYELQVDDYSALNRDVWTLRDGYVEVVNVDEKYWVHVHAYADAHRTTNKDCAVIDYTASLEGEVTYTPVAVTLSAQTEGGAPLAGAATMLLKDAESWTTPLAQGEHTLFAGNTVTLNAAKTGYEFSHWLVNGSRVDGNNIDYTVTGSANEIIAVFTGDGNGGGGEGEDPETPIVSADAEVNVYQNVSKTTTKILYNLDLRQGKDGLWYKPTDMGYGIAWADRNVGAASESAAGDYYNWSKTEPGPLPYNSTGYSGGSLYVGFTLPAANDVATVKMGKDWHTPTYDEWSALLSNAVNGNNRLNNPDDESLYIPIPPTGYYDYYYDGSNVPVNPWLNAASAAFLWTSEVLELYGGELGKTNAGMATNAFDGKMELSVGYIHLAAPVRAVYTPPFVTYTLTIRVGSYEYRYICQQGQKVTVTAIATETGAEFVKWEEDGLTDAVRTFTMTGDMAYTAVFTEPVTPPSEDVSVTVYQSVTETTMKILYDLSPKQGKDGLWYTPVDMGYGVAWADRNVGASSPTDLGSRFRWGDPEARTSFTQVISDIHDYSTGSVLPANKDAATVNMGAMWRMPDGDDAVALRDNTTISGNNRFTNRSDGDSYILLPAYGYKGAYGTYDTQYQYYWTSEYGEFGYSAADDANTHSCIAFARDGNNSYYVGNYDKDDYYAMIPGYGMPIRAIYVPTFDVCTLTIHVEGYQYIYLCQDGQNVTVTAVANEGYEFDRWTEDNNTEAVRTFAVTGNMSYTATFKQAKQEYNIIYKDKGGADFSGTHASGYPTIHTYGTATTLAGASKEGYNFLGWYLTADCTGSAVTTLGATAYTADITLYASWEEKTPDPEDPEDPEEPGDDELHIILYEDKDADYYTDFSNKYNGRRATTVTYNRQFTQSKWSTLCLPFDVNTALVSSLKMTSRVYEFKYTKGDEESGLTLYFAQAKKLTAGKGYIVNANATLAKKDQFIFPGVVINTEADINSGFDIINVEGYNSQGDVYLVGTLRTGRLVGSETGNRYMGLKDNKIYYPNSEEGTNLLAYRSIFRSAVDINAPRVRIVVETEDGEQVSELEVVNGALEEKEPVRKYIENGVLYIERNGRRYTAQGALAD